MNNEPIQQDNIIVSQEAFLDIVNTAVSKENDVFLQTNTDLLTGVQSVLNTDVKHLMQKFKPNIVVKKEDKMDEDFLGVVSLSIKLSLIYGIKIPQAVRNIQEKIRQEVENLTGYKVDKIDISVERLIRVEPE